MKIIQNGDNMEINNKLLIRTRKFKSNDDYKTFSVRLKTDLVDELDKVTKESGYSRNEIISLIIDYGLKNYEIIED